MSHQPSFGAGSGNWNGNANANRWPLHLFILWLGAVAVAVAAEKSTTTTTTSAAAASEGNPQSKFCGLPQEINVLPDFAQDEIRAVWKNYKAGTKCEKEQMLMEDIFLVLEQFDNEFNSASTSAPSKQQGLSPSQQTLQSKFHHASTSASSTSAEPTTAGAATTSTRGSRLPSSPISTPTLTTTAKEKEAPLWPSAASLVGGGEDYSDPPSSGFSLSTKISAHPLPKGTPPAAAPVAIASNKSKPPKEIPPLTSTPTTPEPIPPAPAPASSSSSILLSKGYLTNHNRNNNAKVLGGGKAFEGESPKLITFTSSSSSDEKKEATPKGKGAITRPQKVKPSPKKKETPSTAATIGDAAFISTARPYDRPTRFAVLRVAHDYDEKPEGEPVEEVESRDQPKVQGNRKAKTYRKPPPPLPPTESSSLINSPLYEPSNTLPFLKGADEELVRLFQQVFDDPEVPSEYRRQEEIHLLAVSYLNAQQLASFNAWSTERRKRLRAREQQLHHQHLSRKAREALKHLALMDVGEAEAGRRVEEVAMQLPEDVREELRSFAQKRVEEKRGVDGGGGTQGAQNSQQQTE